MAVDVLLDHDIATTDPVVMEVLAGARDDHHAGKLRELLGRTNLLPCRSEDYSSAAVIYRACRSRGETVRKMVDCLIAAVAIRHSVPVLHHDRDLDVIARHTQLATHA